MVEHKCIKCGHEWEGKERPLACPRCKRYDWNNKNKQEEVEDVFGE
jgi:rubrerythrin